MINPSAELNAMENQGIVWFAI